MRLLMPPESKPTTTGITNARVLFTGIPRSLGRTSMFDHATNMNGAATTAAKMLMTPTKSRNATI
jgi:hypothetical protein